jgi:hypothetical protein
LWSLGYSRPVFHSRYRESGEEEDAMPRGRVLLLLFAAGLLTGCAVEGSSRAVSFLPSSRGFQGPKGLDVVQMNVAVLEVAVGDPYINEQLWGLADEQELTRDQKSAIHENGFRIGQIRGITPPGLQALLTSERYNPNPRYQQVRAGLPCIIDLGPPLTECQCRVRDNGRNLPVEAASAQLGMEVIPTLTADGRVSLHFGPRIGRGRASRNPASPGEAPLWMLLTQRSARRFPELGCDVTLEPNEYVVIGGVLDQPDTLGYRTFIRPEETNTIQRLLVIRTARVLPEVRGDEPEGAGDLKRVPPLALQAVWSSVRGSAP